VVRCDAHKDYFRCRLKKPSLLIIY
jgi:hypothetical protein